MDDRTCNHILSRLDDYLDGTTEQNEQEEIRRHLASCPSCRARYEQAKELLRLTAESAPEPPAELHQTILARVRAERLTARRHRMRRLGTWGSVAAAAVLCLAVLSTPLLSNGGANAPTNNDGEIYSAGDKNSGNWFDKEFVFHNKVEAEEVEDASQNMSDSVSPPAEPTPGVSSEPDEQVILPAESISFLASTPLDPDEETTTELPFANRLWYGDDQSLALTAEGTFSYRFQRDDTSSLAIITQGTYTVTEDTICLSPTEGRSVTYRFSYTDRILSLSPYEEE